jgi:hypothetical protein
VSKTREPFSRIGKIGVIGVALAAAGLFGGEAWLEAGAVASTEAGGGTRVQAENSQEKKGKTENGAMTMQNKFYCNIKALNAAERAHHTQLTEKLLAARKETVETAKGYEFQFSPADVSLADLSDWVIAESKCCPFFDFHIDLENDGKLVCLRLTGAEGVKTFIRAEFGLQ